jgi:hypothetical protein
VLFFIVEDRHLDLSAKVAMEVMTMAYLTFGKFPMVLDGLVAILREDENFLVNLAPEAAGHGDKLQEFCYRGLLARFNELWIHAVVGMNI